jgi:hypothetical protein
MSCYFLIDDFDCQATRSDKCFQALSVRLLSPETPEEERKLFDTCAEEIDKKDSYLGGHARALLVQTRETGPPIDEIGFFHDHLPSVKCALWEAFIEGNKERINAFKLSRFLKERWNLLPAGEKFENLAGVEKIIHLVEDTYSKQAKLLNKALKPVLSEIKDMQRESFEDKVREIVNAHKQAKRWEELNNYIAGLDTAGFSYELVKLLNDEQCLAEEGVLWLHRLEILDRLVDVSLKQMPDAFYREYDDIKGEVYDLVEHQREMAGRETVEDVQQRLEQIYANVLNRLKEWETSPEIKLHHLNRWADEFRLLHLAPHGEWDAYARELGQGMIATLGSEFFDAFKNCETIDDIKQAVEQVMIEADRLGLRDQVDDYAADNQDERIFEIRQHLEEWLEFDRSLERVFTISDPFKLTYNSGHLPGDLERVTGIFASTPVFGKTRKKYRSVDEVVQFVRSRVEVLESFAASMKMEAKKILENKLVLKFESYERQLESVRKEITQVIKKHGIHYKFQVLDKLRKITALIQRLLFRAKKGPLRQSDKELLAQNAFLASIDAALNQGEALCRDLKELKTRFKSPVAGDPVTLQDEFFHLIEAYREKAVLFPRSKVDDVVSLYESLMVAVHDSIERYLKPMQDQLAFPFPLIEHDKIESMREKTGNLLEQMDKIDRLYPGFEELVDTYKDELEQWNHVMDVHNSVRQQAFDHAEKIIENSVYDPDIRYPAQILVYYYRWLFQAEWEEEQWLRFFSRFSLDSIKLNKAGYRVVLKHYQKDARKRFGQFSIASLETHHKIFKTFFPTDDLVPYLAYLCPHPQSDTKTFLKDIQRASSVRPEFFKAVIHLLEQGRDWKKYMDLYRLSPVKYKRYFEKPVEKVQADLEEGYRELLTAFKGAEMTRATVDDYLGSIPEGREFLDYLDKSKRLRDLSDTLKEINANFKLLESEDIWVQDDFYRRVYQTLERHTDKFTGDDFAGIRESNRWEERIATLRDIYDLGRELLLQLDRLAQTDADFKVKAEVAYSNAFSKAVKEMLSTWSRFCDEIAQIPGNSVFKESFQHYYLAHFINTWQRMSLYYLCDEAGLETSQSLDQYFQMWEMILDNHRRFVTLYKKKEGLQRKTLDDHNIKTLDEFIRLTVDRLDQQGRLKKRGEK